VCTIFTAWYLIDLIAFVLGSLRQSKDAVLFEQFSHDENFINTLENVFSCCGVVTTDGLVEHPSHFSRACKPDKGFSTKPHAHCNYIIGERIMKCGWAAVALGPFLILLCYIVFFIYQWLSKCYQETKSRNAMAHSRQQVSDGVMKDEAVVFYSLNRENF
jgi:hypothetical protein